MKKKTNWKTLAALALAAGAWRKLSEDLPIEGVIIPPTERPAPPQCRKWETLKWDEAAGEWRCIPKGIF